MSCVGLWFFLWLHEISFMNPYMKFMNARFFFRAKRDQPSPYGPNEAINALEEQMKAKSDDELRGGPQGKCVFLWVGCLALGVSCLRKPCLKHQKKDKKRKEKEHQPGFVGSAGSACRYISCMICIVLEKNTPNKIHGIFFCLAKIPQLPGVAHAVPCRSGIRFPPWQVPWRKSWSLVHRAEQHWRSCCRKPSPWYVRPKTMGGKKPTERYHPGKGWHIPSLHALSKVSFSKYEFPFPKMLVSWMSFLFQRVGDVSFLEGSFSWRVVWLDFETISHHICDIYLSIWTMDNVVKMCGRNVSLEHLGRWRFSKTQWMMSCMFFIFGSHVSIC